MSGGVEHRDRQVTAETIGVIDVEHRRPGLQPPAHAADDLDVLVRQVERIPVDVGRRRKRTCDRDGVSVRREQIAQHLGRRRCLVGTRLGVFADERRALRQPLHVDADDRVADVGVADGRPGLLIPLLQAEPQLVTPAGRPLLHAGGVGNRRLELRRRRRRSHAWLASHAYEVLRQAAGRARQHHPHAGITRILRVKVEAEGGILYEIGTDAARAEGQGEVALAVGRPGEHAARRIEQFDHGVERRGGLVDVDPHLGAGVRIEAVDVDVRRVVTRNEAMHLESEPSIVVAPLATRGDDAEILCRHRDAVGVDAARVRPLGFPRHRDISIVGVGQELQAPPVCRTATRRAVAVRVLHDEAQRIGACTDGVVLQGREHHRVPRLAEDLHGSADPIVDVGAVAGGREAGVRAQQLHDQAGVRVAHQPQSGGGVEVVDHDLAGHDVDDVRVVPHALDGDLAATDHHTGDAAVARLDRERVAANQRPAVVVVLGVAIAFSPRSARIWHLHVGERVDVDADDGA